MECESSVDPLLQQIPYLVRVSVSVYRLLLFAYPAQLRGEYEPWMAQAFRDQCMSAYRMSGLGGMAPLWLFTLLDCFKTSFEQRTKNGLAMTHVPFTRICGWCLLFGVAAILLGVLSTMLYSGTTDPQNGLYRSYDPLLRSSQLVLIPTWVLLTAVGITGLYARFGAASSRVGRLALALGALGGLASFSFLTVLELAVDNELAIVWEMAMIGLLFMFGGLFVFGLSSLHGRELTERSWLSVAAGGLFLLMMALSIILAAEMPSNLPVLFLGLIAYGLFLLGRLLLRPNPQLTT
jgi:hypothetical protein